MPGTGHFLESLITLMALVNPIAGTFKFLALTQELSEKQRKKTAAVAAFTATIVLLVTVFAGAQILRLFSISIPSFRIGGGILIMLSALGMVNSPTESSETAPSRSRNIGAVPLGMPLLAGPGAISAVIIESQNQADWVGYALLVGCVLVTTLAVWLCFNLAGPLQTLLGKDGVDILTRIMGVLLLALAVEFITKGLAQSFPAIKISPEV